MHRWVEQVAATQLGLRVSQAGLRFDLQRLHHPRTRKGLLRSSGTRRRCGRSRRRWWRASSSFPRSARRRSFRRAGPRGAGARAGAGAEPDRRSRCGSCGSGSTNWPRDAKARCRRPNCGTPRGGCASTTGRSRAFLDQQDEDSVYWVEPWRRRRPADHPARRGGEGGRPPAAAAVRARAGPAC